MLIGRLSIAILGAAALLSLLYAVGERRRMDIYNAPENGAHSTLQTGRSSSRLGLIGDSRVGGGKLDAFLEDAMTRNGLPMKVTSFGQPGAKSREIYRNLLKPAKEPHSSSALFENKDIRYCVIIGGVNDAIGHTGRDFYAHHMVLIARILIDHGIVPIIVELPEFGVEEYQASSTLFAIKRNLFRLLFDGGKDNVIEAYRSELPKLLISNKIHDKLVLISFDDFIPDYMGRKTLYQDPTHLNAAGMRKFSNYLAAHVERAYNAPRANIPQTKSTESRIRKSVPERSHGWAAEEL